MCDDDELDYRHVCDTHTHTRRNDHSCFNQKFHRYAAPDKFQTTASHHGQTPDDCSLERIDNLVIIIQIINHIIIITMFI